MARAKSAARLKSFIGRRRLAAKSEGSEHYTDRRDELRKAAAALFKKKGLRETSLDDIAKLARVDRSSIYYYVSSKMELFFEVVGEAMTQVAEKAEAISASNSSPAEKLEELLVAFMTNYATNYPYLYVYLQENFTREDDPNRELSQKIDRLITRMVSDGMKEGMIRSDLSPKVIAYGMLGMMNWTHRWFDPKGKMTGSEIGREFAKVILGGILTDAGRRAASPQLRH